MLGGLHFSRLTRACGEQRHRRCDSSGPCPSCVSCRNSFRPITRGISFGFSLFISAGSDSLWEAAAHGHARIPLQPPGHGTFQLLPATGHSHCSGFELQHPIHLTLLGYFFPIFFFLKHSVLPLSSALGSSSGRRWLHCRGNTRSACEDPNPS